LPHLTIDAPRSPAFGVPQDQTLKEGYGVRALRDCMPLRFLVIDGEQTGRGRPDFWALPASSGRVRAHSEPNILVWLRQRRSKSGGLRVAGRKGSGLLTVIFLR
jgi:hypothetical protein